VEQYRHQAAPGYNGEHFPPVVLFFDGTTYWMADGFHRARARERAGFNDIPAEIREGGVRDALLYSAGCNTTHGLRRTKEDKLAAVKALLADPEWAKNSGTWIADACGVSHTFVDIVRNSTCNNASSEDQARKGRDGKTRKARAKRERQPGEDGRDADRSRQGRPVFTLDQFNRLIGGAVRELDTLAIEFGLDRNGKVYETPEHLAIAEHLDAARKQAKRWHEQLVERRQQKTA
jgi:hypothetical protein